MDLQEMECVDVDWIEVALDRNKSRAGVSTVMIFRLPLTLNLLAPTTVGARINP